MTFRACVCFQLLFFRFCFLFFQLSQISQAICVPVYLELSLVLSLSLKSKRTHSSCFLHKFLFHSSHSTPLFPHHFFPLPTINPKLITSFCLRCKNLTKLSIYTHTSLHSTQKDRQDNSCNAVTVRVRQIYTYTYMYYIYIAAQSRTLTYLY